MKITTVALLFVFLPARAEAGERVETRIAPDMTVVTETSVGSPFVGQQVAIVYRLRVVEPPAAVDVDPQQFSGFWAESVPLSDSGRRRAADGRFEEYLLRQVVVFPLYGGDTRIPPLRVKVKRSRSRTDPGQWDVIGVSDPVRMQVREPQGGRGRAPLVGSVSGSLFEESRAGAPALFLDLQGTALLALFDPALWLVGTQDGQVTARQVNYENTVQPGDVNEGGLPSLLMRRRWEIRTVGGGGIADLTLSVFHPESQQVTVVRIPSPAPGTSLPGGQPKPPAGDAERQDGSGSWRAVLALWGLGGAVAAAVWVLLRRIRSGTLPAARQAVSGLRDLLNTEEMMSSATRPYFETAHRVVQRCQREVSGDAAARSKADACRAAVERWRFSPAAPPPESRREIAALFRDLLLECERTGKHAAGTGGTGGPSTSKPKPLMLE